MHNAELLGSSKNQFCKWMAGKKPRRARHEKIPANLIQRSSDVQGNRLKSKPANADTCKRNDAAVCERGKIDEAVAILGLCARTVRHLAFCGELPGAAKIYSGAVRSFGEGFRPTAATSDGRYARTIQSLRLKGGKGKETDK
jgi:ribosomal protein S14